MLTKIGSGARTRVRRLLAAAVVVACAVAVQSLGFRPAVSQVPEATAYAADDGPGLDPHSGPWGRVPGANVPMTAQNQTYPLGGGEVPVANVRAIHAGETLYVRVEWPDASENTSSYGTDRFADAVAVQFPGQNGSSSPAFCMGQADGGVNIWQWRADAQAGVPQTLVEDHPNGYVDEAPPLPDDLSYPARAVGNPFADGADQPVQNLVATGFGTIGPAAEGTVQGEGVHNGDSWAVVFARPFVSPGQGQPAFRVGEKTDVAVAAWDGARGDRNGQKSVSQFLGLTLSDEHLPADRSWMIFALLVGVLGLGAIIAFVYWRAT